MSTSMSQDSQQENIQKKAEVIFKEQRQLSFGRVDKLFCYLMVGQWLFAILIAVLVAPYQWEGKVRSINVHVPVAIFLGAAIGFFPILALSARWIKS